MTTDRLAGCESPEFWPGNYPMVQLNPLETGQAYAIEHANVVVRDTPVYAKFTGDPHQPLFVISKEEYDAAGAAQKLPLDGGIGGDALRAMGVGE
jgi:hypothetical protein